MSPGTDILAQHVRTLDPFILLGLQLVEELDTVLEEFRRRLQLTPTFSCELTFARPRAKGDGPQEGTLTWQRSLLPSCPLPSFPVLRAAH